MSSSFTTNLSLELPEFDVATWHDGINNNFQILDLAVSGSTFRPAWLNNHTYAINDQAIDVTTFTVYNCLVAHTSAVAGTFAADRALHPTFWQQLVIAQTNLVSTDASATAGPDFSLSRDSPSPAASDNLGRLLFRGRDSAGNAQDYAAVQSGISSPTNGNEFGTLALRVAVGGSLTEIMVIDGLTGAITFFNTGLINIGSVLNIGGQITFPAVQNPSADANTLDDYEEGTFTPTIIGLSTAGVGTYSSQIGDYTKEGNRCFFTADVTWTAHTGTGGISVGPMPFTAASGASLSIYWDNLTYTSTPMAIIAAAGTTVLLRMAASNAAQAVIPIEAAARVIVSGHYKTA